MKLTRESGTLVRAWDEPRHRQAGTDRAELRKHNAFVKVGEDPAARATFYRERKGDLVIWIQDGATWRIWIAGETCARYAP